jgi:hypothetical protein
MEFVYAWAEIRRVATERYFQRGKELVHSREQRLWSTNNKAI